MPNIVADWYQGQAQHYSRQRRLGVDPFLREVDDRFVAWAAAQVFQSAPAVCDLGSADGRALELFAESHPSADLVAVDLSAELLEARLAREWPAGPPQAIVGDMTMTGLPDRSYDAVVSLLAAHLPSDFREVAQEAHRLLRPGGRLFLSLLGNEAVDSQLMLAIPDWLEELGFPDVALDCRRVLKFPSYEEVLGSLTSAGLDVWESEQYDVEVVEPTVAGLMRWVSTRLGYWVAPTSDATRREVERRVIVRAVKAATPEGFPFRMHHISVAASRR